MTRQQRHLRARKKITALFPSFTKAFDVGGLEEAEKRLRWECRVRPHESHIARAAFREIKALVLRSSQPSNLPSN